MFGKNPAWVKHLQTFEAGTVKIKGKYTPKLQIMLLNVCWLAMLSNMMEMSTTFGILLQRRNM